MLPQPRGAGNAG